MASSKKASSFIRSGCLVTRDPKSNTLKVEVTSVGDQEDDQPTPTATPIVMKRTSTASLKSLGQIMHTEKALPLSVMLLPPNHPDSIKRAS
jgi:hypothetical protein